MAGEPSAYLWVLMGGVIVDDQVDVQLCRDAVVEATQKREKLLMPVSRFAFGENGPGGDVQRGKQCLRLDLMSSTSGTRH